MPVDPKYLRQHYGSLSDQALLALDRADLVAAAQNCYDDEIRRRGLASPRSIGRADATPVAPKPPAPAHEKAVAENATVHRQPSGDERKPDWLEDAAEVYS